MNLNSRRIFYTILICLFISPSIYGQNKKINLKGEWKFDLDRNDIGEKQRWFAKKLKDYLMLPGSMGENRKEVILC